MVLLGNRIRELENRPDQEARFVALEARPNFEQRVLALEARPEGTYDARIAALESRPASGFKLKDDPEWIEHNTREDKNEQDRMMMISGFHPRHQNRDGVINFAYDQLRISIYHEDIESAMAIGNNRSGQSITKVLFTNMEARIRYYRARISLKGSTDRIFINEDLTKTREKLNFLACKLFREGKIVNNWSFLGNIFVKKTADSDAVRITTEEELAQFSN